MKKTILSFLTILAISTGVNAQNVTIPDANFKAYLVGNASINTNSDTEIQVSEASAFTGNVNCQNLNISDLTGIEAFTYINYLYCNDNQLTNLDISNCLDLLGLRCHNNYLTSLDLSNNIYLTEIYCYANYLTNLDVLNLTDLETFRGEANQISSLDFSGATNLVFLKCGYNNLSYLNVANGNNANMPSFQAQSNPSLTCIEVDDVSYSTTNWTFIDPASSFSTNCPPPPCTVNIPDANFKAYLVGNTTINTNGNAEIECSEASTFTGAIDCSGSSISDLTGIEAFTSLTDLTCFSNSLSSLDVTQNTALTSLNCGFTTINSLDLSQNTNLEFLFCHGNAITSLDVTQNTNLKRLFCNDNSLSSIDVNINTLLERLDFSNNLVSNVDLSLNTALTHLLCTQTALSALDLSNNSSLDFFNCSNNSLNSLNIANGNNSNFSFYNSSSNSTLSCIQVDNVAYSTTNWTNVDVASSFSTNCPSPCTVAIPDANFKAYLVGNTAINTNGDTEIQCSEASAFTGTINCPASAIFDLTGIEAFTSLTELSCSVNSLTSLDVSSNISLISLYCYSNSLTSLDVSNVTSLQTLQCNDNFLTSISVSQNTQLTTLWCQENSIANIDVTQNIALTNFACGNNLLSSLDVTLNTALTKLYCDNNTLTALNVANGNNSNFSDFIANNNPNLTCIQVDDVNYSTTNWTSIDAIASFSLDCNGGVGVNEVADVQFNIYPNPVQNKLFIEIAELSVIEMTILDLSGKVIKTITNNNAQSIDVSNLNQGVYILKIHTENGVSTNRFIKQ